LIGRYAGNRIKCSEKMVRAHRGIASKQPKRHWLFRLCFDPAQASAIRRSCGRLRTASPAPLSTVAAAATRRAASSNPRSSSAASAAEMTGSSLSEGERRGIVKVRRRARGTEATISSKSVGDVPACGRPIRSACGAPWLMRIGPCAVMRDWGLRFRALIIDVAGAAVRSSGLRPPPRSALGPQAVI
jgi:hypothetical protein